MGLALDVSTDDEGGVLGAVHLGTEPNRFDLLTSLRGVSNQAVFEAAQGTELEGVAVKIISLRHLVEAKQSSDRARDLADVEELLKINEVR